METSMKGADIDWDVIRGSVDQEDWGEDPMNPDNEVRGVFLGTVFALTPSGKYYTFWTTNQTDEDVNEDQKWFEKNQKEAEERGLTLESGEGDPCDLFAMEYRDRE